MKGQIPDEVTQQVGIKRRIYELDSEINPPDLRPLPPDVPMPVRQHPCLRSQN